MKTKLYQLRSQFKSFLFVAGLLLVSAVLIYTQKLVDELRNEARGILEFYVQFYEQAVSSPNDENLNFIFEEIIKRTTFPIILTDSDGMPTGWKGLAVSGDDTSPEALVAVKKIADAMKNEIDPLPLKYEDYVLGYLIYGDSESVRELQWLPYFELGAVALFILIGFFGFNSIRHSEQQFIWVGMAKETAHQLGTPISSLMGWSTLLKDRCEDEPEKIKIINEIEQDVQRLETAAQRFSQIGSKPDIKPENVNEIIAAVLQYYNRRLPQMHKKVKLQTDSSLTEKVPVNANLFQWVLENLVKNALDAIGTQDGVVTIKAQKGIGKKPFIIDVIDNGRGMDSKTKKNIFRPGFSTKKRGWGLGLNLAKRIVEEYHGGKLTLRESQPGEGATFRIQL
ncbi:MAG: sensor histidine kinase [Calditrichaeota bacterium]|nr:MAG: sensor histidine kinase [Calditrichota bacterium]